MSEKEKKRMWPQSSLAAMGSFTLGDQEGPVRVGLLPQPPHYLSPTGLAGKGCLACTKKLMTQEVTDPECYITDLPGKT